MTPEPYRYMVTIDTGTPVRVPVVRPTWKDQKTWGEKVGYAIGITIKFIFVCILYQVFIRVLDPSGKHNSLAGIALDKKNFQ